MLIKILKALEQEIKRLREAIRFIKTTESRFFRLIEIASRLEQMKWEIITLYDIERDHRTPDFEETSVIGGLSNSYRDM
jgi:hypothetical protein